MLRKKYLAVLLVLCGLLGLWLSVRLRSGSPLRSKLGYYPKASVFLVTIDTTRADYLGAYGSRSGFTPFLDRLAAEGVVFDQAQAVAPLTLPSHTSIMTGLYPLHHGVRNNGMFSLPKGVETLAQEYSREGYATGAFVSAQVLIRRYGLDRGFDVYNDDLSKSRKSGRGMVPSRPGNITLEDAEAWLDGIDPGKPVFMWLHLYDPHAPRLPPPEFRKKFPTDPYGAEIAFADDLVRRLSEYLEKSGRLKHSLITVLADHGESLGEHGEQTHGILLHQATIHVPWILVTPRRGESLRIREAVSTVDVPAVLAELTGITPPNAERMDARIDFFDRKETKEKEIYYETALPLFQYGWSPLRALRKDSWEIVRGSRDELFNLRHDPRELADLSATNPLELKYFQAQLEKLTANDTSLHPESVEEIKPNERAALEALGYVGTTAAPRENPPDPRDLIGGHVHVESAREALGAGRYEEALKDIDLMLKDDPGNLSALSMKAQVLLRTGQTDQAEAILKDGLAIDPKNSDLVAGLCRVAWLRGQFQKVIETAALGRSTRSPFGTFDAYEVRALLKLGRLDDARAHLKQSLEKMPEDGELLVARAKLDLLENDSAAAEKHFRQAIDADTFNLQARDGLGRLLQSQGRRDEAASVYEEMLRIDPSDLTTLEALGLLKLNSDPEAALPYLREAVRLAPGKRSYLQALGAAQLKTGRSREAEASLKRAVSLGAKDLGTLNNLAIVSMQQGHYSQAVASLRALLKQNPSFFSARNNLAVALTGLARFKEAENEVRKALKQNPAFVDGIMTLASILQHEERWDEEYSLLAGAKNAEVDPNYARLLGIAAAKSGHCDIADRMRRKLADGGGRLDDDFLKALEGCGAHEE